ncbi:MAG: hypothetical protein ACPG47_08560 [Leucothrix sp.]
MNQLITLLLSSALLIMLVSASANALPPNAHAVGNGWKCNTGYKRQGQQCNKIFIPPNAVFRGQGWICNAEKIRSVLQLVID